MKRRRGPIRANGDGFVVDLGADEAAVLAHLLGELRSLLTDPTEDAQALLVRLFPVAHPGDAEAEAEYQRLMRDDLVQSRLAAIERVEQVLAERGPVDAATMLAFMQAVNALRLILGTMLDVSDDPALARDGVTAELASLPEYDLYKYLSWLLEHSVRSLSRAGS